MTIVKTELSGMEDHRKAVQEDIARRAYALYEADDFKDGLDLDHWFWGRATVKRAGRSTLS